MQYESVFEIDFVTLRHRNDSRYEYYYCFLEKRSSMNNFDKITRLEKQTNILSTDKLC